MGEPVSISLLGFFVSAASAFGKLLSHFRNVRHQTQDEVANYFDQIAACLREVAERIENGQPPRDTCRRLAVFAAELQNILGRDGYLTAAGDASIDETRLRLAGEIQQARNIWVAQSDDKAIEVGVKKLTQAFYQNATEHDYYRQSAEISGNDEFELDALLSRWISPKATVQRFEDQIILELDAQMGARRDTGVQEIWDAAGEFAALANALRARR